MQTPHPATQVDQAARYASAQAAAGEAAEAGSSPSCWCTRCRLVALVPVAHLDILGCQDGKRIPQHLCARGVLQLRLAIYRGPQHLLHELGGNGEPVVYAHVPEQLTVDVVTRCALLLPWATQRQPQLLLLRLEATWGPSRITGLVEYQHQQHCLESGLGWQAGSERLC